MSKLETGALVLASDWLGDTPHTTTTVGGMINGSTTTYGDTFDSTTTVYTYPWWATHYYYHYDTPRRPIKLKLSEVEKLRKAAKADAKLKEILQKFTDHIEITVDFD